MINLKAKFFRKLSLITSHLLVQSFCAHAVQRGEVTIQDHALSTQDQNTAFDALSGDQGGVAHAAA